MHANMHLKHPKYALKTPKYALKTPKYALKNSKTNKTKQMHNYPKPSYNQNIFHPQCSASALGLTIGLSFAISSSSRRP